MPHLMRTRVTQVGASRQRMRRAASRTSRRATGHGIPQSGGGRPGGAGPALRRAPEEAAVATRRSIGQLMDLRNRKALVTGGAGHLAQAVCETLLELGATITLVDQDPAAVQRRMQELLERNRQGRVLPRTCDLQSEHATRRMIREATEAMEGLGIIIHCAAYVGATQVPGWSVPFDQQTVEAWDTAMRVNLTSAFVMAQEAAPALTASGHGSVLLFGSIYGLVGPDLRLYEGEAMGHPAGYDASKGGLLQLTRYLATVLAPAVRVNAISPGGVWRGHPEAFHQRYRARTPLGRMATHEDLKGAVAYLASDLSSYVTGHNLVVDGGWTIW